jgi:Ca2+-binding RTX toxin-like protein
MRATKTLNRNRVLALAAATVGLVGLLAGPVLAATINGTSGDDELVGTPEADTIRGYAGNDTVWGRLGGDTINPGSGNDVVRGGRGNDWVEIAGPGADRAFGERGRDVAKAGLGDVAFLGVGDD